MTACSTLANNETFTTIRIALSAKSRAHSRQVSLSLVSGGSFTPKLPQNLFSFTAPTVKRFSVFQHPSHLCQLCYALLSKRMPSLDEQVTSQEPRCINAASLLPFLWNNMLEALPIMRSIYIAYVSYGKAENVVDVCFVPCNFQISTFKLRKEDGCTIFHFLLNSTKALRIMAP